VWEGGARRFILPLSPLVPAMGLILCNPPLQLMATAAPGQRAVGTVVCYTASQDNVSCSTATEDREVWGSMRARSVIFA